jgi:hypothetical protein
VVRDLVRAIAADTTPVALHGAAGDSPPAIRSLFLCITLYIKSSQCSL